MSKFWEHDDSQVNLQKETTEFDITRGMINRKTYVVSELSKGVDCLRTYGTTEREHLVMLQLQNKLRAAIIEYNLLVGYLRGLAEKSGEEPRKIIAMKTETEVARKYLFYKMEDYPQLQYGR